MSFLFYSRYIRFSARLYRSCPIFQFRDTDGRVLSLAVLITMVTWITGSSSPAYASMYACRDSSGTIHYTNVLNSPSCKPLKLKKSRQSWNKPYKGKSSSRYDRDIKRIASRYRIDPPLIKAIIHAESGFDARAVSKKGAQGLMQLMPDTARELRVSNPFNPRENIDGGTRYFRQMLDSFNNNLVLSLAAYNAGPGLVKRTGGVPRFSETRKYIYKVLKQYKVYKASW